MADNRSNPLILDGSQGELESVGGCIVVEHNLQKAHEGDRIKESLIASISNSLSSPNPQNIRDF